jgi:hypothetical protein
MESEFLYQSEECGGRVTFVPNLLGPNDGNDEAFSPLTAELT